MISKTAEVKTLTSYDRLHHFIGDFTGYNNSADVFNISSLEFGTVQSSNVHEALSLVRSFEVAHLLVTHLHLWGNKDFSDVKRKILSQAEQKETKVILFPGAYLHLPTMSINTLGEDFAQDTENLHRQLNLLLSVIDIAEEKSNISECAKDVLNKISTMDKDVTDVIDAD